MKRTPARILTQLAVGAAVFSAAWPAFADGVKATDVLLLIDTSGSMGLTTVRDPNDPTKYAPPQCATYPASSPVNLNATDFSGATPPDRWSILVAVLTGSVKGHSCSSQPRTTNEFVSEFSLGGTSPGAGTDPYDDGYYMPFNRIIAKYESEECTPAPSWDSDIRTQLTNNAMKWPTNASGGPIYWRDTSQNIGSAAHCSFAPQDRDGVLDDYPHSIRLGLMTFDSKPHWVTESGAKTIGTGVVTSSNPPEAHYPSGVGDTWSFFPNWRTDPSTGYGVGWPGGCENQADALLEVGARNPAAPPWEGRLISFGDPNAGTDEIIRNNDRVQQALTAIRPYGATPIAGMLEDARYFLREDDTKLTDTDGTGYYWGGKLDEAADPAGAACRNRVIILITDGGPNLDVRPDCAYTIDGTAGECPYPTPEETVEALANPANPQDGPPIKTYVIGFALSTVGGASTCTDLLEGADPCSALTGCSNTACTSGQCAYGYCINSPDQETLAACCKIDGIASKGGTEAEWAEDADSLKKAVKKILDANEPQAEVTTQPVFSAGSAHYDGSDEIAAAEFFNSFEASPNHIDVGSLERHRWVCDPDEDGIPVAVDKDPVKADGDIFNENVDDFKAERTVYTVVAEEASDGKIQSERSIRPWYSESTGDGLGKVGVLSGSSTTTKMVTGVATDFATQVNAKALIGDDVCTENCCFDTPTDKAPSAEKCRTRFLNLELALPAGEADIEADVRTSAFAPIVGAAPVLNGAPDDYLRDESYRSFQQVMANRELVLFAPTIDGQLHAFKTTHAEPELNELWTFMPPAVLPRLESQFAGLQASITRNLLDGPIVLNDVAGRVGESSRFLTRTKAEAVSASSTTTRWHSILVGAFGSSPGYYALDVSWPNPTLDAPPGYTKGPRFLWQLTTDVDGRPLFGTRSTTPTITTLFFKMPGEEELAEHAVAILPGGYGGERSDSTEDVLFNPSAVDAVDDKIDVRPQTHVYTPTVGSTNGILHLAGARSLTIVRLDTGEVIRTFRRGIGESPVVTDNQAPPGLYAQDRVTNAPFDAPIMGRVIAYPNGPGAVSDRAYVGDAEGRLWRVDLTSSDPGDWSVDLFHDAYPASGLGLSFTPQDAAPIETPPILSTDPLGRLTIAVSTGDQRTLTKKGEYLVWSLTETKVNSKPKAQVNWFLSSDNAENSEGAPAPGAPHQNYEENAPHLDNGERVTGPMVLFNSVLHFTTFAPSDDPCDGGESFLWGVHYVNRKPGTEPEDGPAPLTPPTPPDDDDTSQSAVPANELLMVIPLGKGAVFGPSITAKPPCYATDDVAGDPFLGFGSHKSITSVKPTQFQLVVQRPGAGTGSETNVYRRNLFPPLGGGRIDSWASILE